MKTTDMFATVISTHLKSVAEKDSLFAESLKKANKNIKDCCTYILNEVQKSGRNGFADEEVFNMAIHYYDEDEIKPGAAVNARVIVNHRAEGAKQKMEKAIVARKNAPEVNKAAKKTTAIDKDLVNQISLF